MKASLLIGLGLMALCQASPACKFRDVGLDEHMKQEQVAFIAQAESPSNGMSGNGPETPAMMRVLQSIKGPASVGQLVPVYTSNSSCGLGIQKGQQWLIFASGERMRSDQPSGSLLLHDQSVRRLVSQKLGIALD